MTDPPIQQFTNPLAAVLYGRVSTDQQTTGTQEARCKDYLKYKWGPEAVAVAEFYDDAVSGTIPLWKRPQGRLLLARLQAGDVRHLVVAKLDRLGRKAMDLLNTVQFLDSQRIVLHIVDLGGDSLSTQCAAGRLMITVLAGMAEYERELIQSRICEKLGVKRSKGELCGTESYGWNAVETGETRVSGKCIVKIKRLEDNPEEQKWILYMVRQRELGFGYHTIAKKLNALGVPTKRRGEVLRLLNGNRSKEDTVQKFTTGKWQSGNVAKILNSKTVQTWLRNRSLQVAAAA
jgi:DNA invertase Pin-like site-specific DNA recombinase